MLIKPGRERLNIASAARSFTYLRLRDFSRGQSVALGEGEVNLTEVMEHLHLLPKLEWVVVEFEPTENALEKFQRK
ncbi:hypothetical protein [Enterovibrio paralichthyis]|uniref:hypothetical protein n=1 Tax=Enterovibrio paralichthyis TaxID=2853805 RepID=UPI001C49007D|nr:hypothetical protein [Enterovibrio paralichthyis]MBV7297382.1 hypothetical protein [Enterovibrio paralichthyis]